MTDMVTDTALSDPAIAPAATPLALRPRGETGPMTPAGLQNRRSLALRRAVVLTLNLVTLGLLTWGIAEVFGAGGWSLSDIVIVGCFMIGAPWTVMGLWNAVIGLWLLHGRREGIASAAPHLDAGASSGPISSRIAIAMTLRNEDTARALDRLAEIRRSVNATGDGLNFDVFVLSDSSDPEIIET
ncbi:MAG: hypothetical protein AAGI13_14505, partial [Pseudomonadota bacterium]